MLAFALGKALDDVGDYARAFEMFSEGNRIGRAGYSFDFSEDRRPHKPLRAVFDEAWFEEFRGAGIADDCPIFVFGLPRSGTTLVEQILASHPRVFGAGELDILHRIVTDICVRTGRVFPHGMRELDRELLKDGARRYVAELRARGGDADYVTDKMLATVIYVGLIHVMLPGARLVYVSRDPRDQGLSYFQTDFGDQQPYSHDLVDIAEYIRLYRSTVAHWDEVLPGAIHHIRYEDLVAEPEAETRALLAHCGLAFDPACLSFYDAARPVDTASVAQVRRPIYSASVGRWRRYERQLQPLIAALDLDDEAGDGAPRN